MNYISGYSKECINLFIVINVDFFWVYLDDGVWGDLVSVVR